MENFAVISMYFFTSMFPFFARSHPGRRHTTLAPQCWNQVTNRRHHCSSNIRVNFMARNARRWKRCGLRLAWLDANEPAHAQRKTHQRAKCDISSALSTNQWTPFYATIPPLTVLWRHSITTIRPWRQRHLSRLTICATLILRWGHIISGKMRRLKAGVERRHPLRHHTCLTYAVDGTRWTSWVLFCIRTRPRQRWRFHNNLPANCFRWEFN